MARTINSPTNTDGPKTAILAGTSNVGPGGGPSMAEIRNDMVLGTMKPMLRSSKMHPTNGAGENRTASPTLPPGQ